MWLVFDTYKAMIIAASAADAAYLASNGRDINPIMLLVIPVAAIVGCRLAALMNK